MPGHPQGLGHHMLDRRLAVPRTATVPSLPNSIPGLTLRGHAVAGAGFVLTEEALRLLTDLERTFRARRAELLQRRASAQAEFDAGRRLDFLAATREVRESEWSVAPAPVDLRDRRVELRGPVDREPLLAALRSEASAFVADLEDALAPKWQNVIDAQVNLRDAVRRELRHVDSASHAALELPEGRLPTLIVRPRAWHRVEKHVLVDGTPVSAALFDFALFTAHSARTLVARGGGAYFELPRLENHLEARLWNDVFVHAEDALGLTRGALRASVRIETLPAAFEMEEILFELREHSAGLGVGRDDYLCSFVRTFRAVRGRLLPDRSAMGPTQPFLRALDELRIQTCHRRGAHALGGTIARLPLDGDPDETRRALDEVALDARREARAGHDGTTVAHPRFVGVARMEFDPVLTDENQLARLREDVRVGATELLAAPAGAITGAGLVASLDLGLERLEARLAGGTRRARPGRFEDAAAFELARAQVWQWLHHRAQLDDGRVVDQELVLELLAEVVALARLRLGEEAFAASRYPLAADLFGRALLSREFDGALAAAADAHLD